MCFKKVFIIDFQLKTFLFYIITLNDDIKNNFKIHKYDNIIGLILLTCTKMIFSTRLYERSLIFILYETIIKYIFNDLNDFKKIYKYMFKKLGDGYLYIITIVISARF